MPSAEQQTRKALHLLNLYIFCVARGLFHIYRYLVYRYRVSNESVVYETLATGIWTVRSLLAA